MTIFELESKLANIESRLQTLAVQLDDETLSDSDWELLKQEAIVKDQERSMIRSQIASLKNAEIVAAKVESI